MALSPEQIAAQISDLGTDLPFSLAIALENAAMIAIEEIKANPNFPVNTGRLKNSLQARMIDGQFLGITMENYGFFQNFGVEGTINKTRQFGVDEITRTFLPPREGDTYKFNKQNKMIGGDLPFGARVNIHRNGLNAKRFFDTFDLVERVVEIANQNFEL